MNTFKKVSLSVFLLFAACSENGTVTEDSIRLARVGNYYLTLDEAREAIPGFVFKQDSVKALKTYRNEWIHQKLLLQKAADLNLANRQTVQQKLRQARQRVLTEAVRQSVFATFEQKHQISEAEALQYYQNHKEQFVLQERYVRFRHLSTSNVEDARAGRQELQAGTPWTKVTKLYGEQAEERLQQSQKYWPVSVVLNNYPALEEYIAALDSSEISPVRRIKGTYHFIQLTGARAEGEYVKPEWILDQIKEWLMLEKKAQFYNSYVKNLYLNAKEHNEIDLYNVLISDESKTNI